MLLSPVVWLLVPQSTGLRWLSLARLINLGDEMRHHEANRKA
jgi:hypothetical protein